VFFDYEWKFLPDINGKLDEINTFGNVNIREIFLAARRRMF
jgi:hypothetical protein